MASFNALSDTDLARMTHSAWREASRDWQEARRAPEAARPMLIAAAESADAYWRDLRDEQDRRLEAAADMPDEVRSSDTYVAADPIPQSPWVIRAQRNELPPKALQGGSLRVTK